jgi:transposase-like protein
MPRLTPEQWEKARAEYEVRGVSLNAVARQFGVNFAAVSRRAKHEGWAQGKSHNIVEKKIAAIKALTEADAESHTLPMTFQHTIETVVKERLQAEGLLASLDVALAVRGLEILRKADSPDQWETMTRGRRNLAPPKTEPQQTTVNVNQQQAQGVALSPRDALAELVMQATGETDAVADA